MTAIRREIDLGTVHRAPTSMPVTSMQLVIATLLGLNYSHAAVAEQLRITRGTVRDHIKRLARRIPGDLPAEQKIVAWVRGATLDVLEGRALRYEVMRRGEEAARANGDVALDIF